MLSCGSRHNHGNFLETKQRIVARSGRPQDLPCSMASRCPPPRISPGASPRNEVPVSPSIGVQQVQYLVMGCGGGYSSVRGIYSTVSGLVGCLGCKTDEKKNSFMPLIVVEVHAEVAT